MARASLPPRHEDQRGHASGSAASYIARQFADRPDLRDAVTPTYPYPGKRPVVASTFYPALKKDNVELVPRAVSSVTRTGIVDADGVERAVDVIVMATGFQPADYLARLRVVGRDGRTLQEHWAGEPRAYLGITVPEFPNFFMLYGPGTNGGEIVIMLESQAEYAVRAVKRMMRERVTAIEVKPSFEAGWHRWLQARMEGTSWTTDQQLLPVTDREDRDPVALRQPALPRAHQAPGPRVGDDVPARQLPGRQLPA